MGPELLFLAVWGLCALVGAIYVGIAFFKMHWLKGVAATAGLAGGFLPLLLLKGPAALVGMSYVAMFGSVCLLLAGALRKDRPSIMIGGLLVLAFFHQATTGRWIRYDSPFLLTLPAPVAEFAMLLAPLVLMFGLSALSSRSLSEQLASIR